MHQYGRGYCRFVAGVLTKPGVCHCEDDPATQEGDELIQPPADALSVVPTASVPSRLIVYAALSFLLGLVVNGAIPGRGDVPALTVSLVVVLLVSAWYASGTHMVCWILRGRGTYRNTFVLSMQLASVLYLVSSVAAFLAASVMRSDLASMSLIERPDFVSSMMFEPASYYFLFHTALMLVYLANALGAIHRFGWGRRIAAAVLAVAPALLVSLNVYVSTGILLPLASPPV